MHKPAVLALLVAGVASCSLGPKYSVYGADLETRDGARAILWAKDGAYLKFRYVVERKGEGADRVRLLQRRAGVEPLGGLGPIAGATVMLPPGVTPDQRDAANQLLGEIAAHQPSMSAHLVVTGVEWTDVTTVEGVIERSREARDVMLPNGGTQTTFYDFLRALSPELVVLPMVNSDETSSDGFLVAWAMQPVGLLQGHDPAEYEYASASTADHVVRMMATPSDHVASSAKFQHADRAPLRTAVVLIPSDAERPCREACKHLLAQLLDEADDSWMIVRRVTDSVRSIDLTEAEGFDEAMPELVISALLPGGRGGLTVSR